MESHITGMRSGDLRMNARASIDAFLISRDSWRRWPDATIPYVISSEFSQVRQTSVPCSGSVFRSRKSKFSEEISHNNLLVFSARTKCDCQSNAAVPPENLHQVWFCLVMGWSRKVTHVVVAVPVPPENLHQVWFCVAMGWSRKVTHVVIGIRMRDQYLFRFRPKTSERAYIHIMKVTESKEVEGKVKYEQILNASRH